MVSDKDGLCFRCNRQKHTMVSVISGFLLLSISGCALASPIVGGFPADPPNMATASTTSTTKSPQVIKPAKVTTKPPQVSFVTQPPIEPPLAAIVSSMKNITITGLQLPGLLAFLGIRYAKAPVGNRRFQRPKRLKLTGDVEAVKYGAPCPQMKDNQVVGNEDCLFLNVYAPEEGLEKGGLPVLFWIHGGHHRSGSGSQYNPEKLINKGLIVVTPQYRLGSLGFLSTGRQELPGNAALFDIGAALKWTKENIKQFGGNPNKIIPAGQGSGASLATFLAVNPITSPIIQGLICLSGTAISPFSVDKVESETASNVSLADGCTFSKGLDFVRCMQELPVEKIVEGDNSLNNKRKEAVDSVASLSVPGPAEESIKDDRFLPSFHSMPVLDAIKQGLFPDNIPLLTGVTNKETCGAVKGDLSEPFKNKLKLPSFLKKNILNDLLKANTGLYNNKTVNPSLKSLFGSDSYLKFFGLLTQPFSNGLDKVVKLTTDALFNLPVFVMSHLWSKKGKVYLFSLEDAPKRSFSHKFLPDIILANPFQEKRGAQHGDDLGYLFKPQDIFGNPLPDSELHKDDAPVSDYYVNMVYEFARSGTPKLKDGVEWQPFSPEKNNYMSITKAPQQKKDFNKCEMGLWTGNADILKSIECSQVGEAATAIMNLLGGTGTNLLNSVTGTTDGITTGINKAVQPIEAGINNVETGLTNATEPIKSGLNNVTSTIEGTLTKPFGNLFGGGYDRRPSQSDSTSNTSPQRSKNLLGDLGLGGANRGFGLGF